MRHIAYFCITLDGLPLREQMAALSGTFSKVFADERVGAVVIASRRAGFGRLLKYVAKGDVLSVYSVDCLGRDAIDVHATVHRLLAMGVSLQVHGVGPVVGKPGQVFLKTLTRHANAARRQIIQHTSIGRERARVLLAEGKTTLRGKFSLGRPLKASPAEVRAWKQMNNSSCVVTAQHFNLSLSTIKRYCGPSWQPKSVCEAERLAPLYQP